MKFLVTSSTFPGTDLDGSVPRFIYDLSDALSRHVHVTVLVPHYPGASLRDRMGSVNVVRFRYWWPTSSESLTPNMRQQLRRSILAKLQVPSFLVSQLLHLRHLVRAEAIDVVNAHWIVPQGILAALLRTRRAPKFQLIVHAHASDVYLLEKLPFGRSIARYITNRADVIFADGSHVRDTLDQLIGSPSGARIQPMGVDAEAFGASPISESDEPPLFPDGFILFVGRLVEKKGVVYLIRAMPRVLQSHPGLGLVVVGDGPEADHLIEEAERLGLSDQVQFVGRQDHKTIIEYLRKCRLAVVPSIIDKYGETEGMPTVVLEMMAAGVPVVGSEVDGIPDVIRDGENGWLCEQKNPDDLAEKILMAVATDSDSEIVNRARATARQYDWRRVAQNYIDVVER